MIEIGYWTEFQHQVASYENVIAYVCVNFSLANINEVFKYIFDRNIFNKSGTFTSCVMQYMPEDVLYYTFLGLILEW